MGLTKKDPTSSTSNQTAPSKPRRKAKKVADGSKTIAPGGSQPETFGTQNDAAKPIKGRSRNTAKRNDSGNMTLAGKVTKTSGDPPAKKSSEGGKKKTIATELSSLEDAPAKFSSKESNVLGKDEVLHLDEAVRRRIDWTPPRETAYEGIATVNNGGSQSKYHDANLMAGFGKLVSDYNYSGLTLNPRDFVQNANSGGPTKRRRIELVTPEIQALLNGRSSDSSDQTSAQGKKMASSGKPQRTVKSKPKKFTTLTARMTAQYSKNDAEEDELVIDSLPDTRTTKGKRRRAKETEKQSSFAVLSPEAAVEFLNDQDLVFGTCSQLERDDSPQTLREIQQAIRASEGLSYPEGTHKKDSRTTQESSTRSVSRLAGTRNLWCVGARDTEGSLIQLETLNVVDLTDGGEPPAKKGHDNVEQASQKSLRRDWFELEFPDIDSPPEKRPPLAPLTERDLDSDTLVQAPAPILAATAMPMTEAKAAKPAKPAKEAENTPTEAVDFQSTTSQASPMPQYTGFTDAELSKQIFTYGFKAVRGRKKMIDLLQKCWESKHGRNLTSGSQPTYQPEQQKDPVSKMDKVLNPTSATKTKATVKSKSGTSIKSRKSLDETLSTSISRTSLQISPKKNSRGKPTTGTSSSLMDVEEIQDSEEDIIPSPIQVQKHYADIYAKSKTSGRMEHNSLTIFTKTPHSSPTKRKVVSPISVKRPSSSASITDNHAAEFSEEISLAEISAKITQAVRVQPRLSPLLSSRGSRIRPTWHEKILMYDPIILEDFTAWLNVEGLGLVGEDREVGTAFVREWCESKGICCCWKKNVSW
ncbi:Structure-specific endonuclease subunit slx4 [Penicillium digitatum]|uniref:Structure-specific endonuclease subunit SLX4 n=3 Tax=Penicillium digitatum TaxID=36651 RepID=K9G7X0_PEND2|nr:Structure-specific endonuclease subunit slx4 [Penicillium digitatum Pd1]EKV07831.1 Structure-specific endonuclease subunit slx4 [Penicillium digitatum Pd1]EKV09321.1 Structure-specific endonuclease subunit slx4 [Penicillium digitatum PHI26]QQK41380.1 Structure-specific endonuclease subunit slx4 [Penicillium digitatum]